MKKIISFILVLVMGLALLTGCTKEPAVQSTSAPTEPPLSPELQAAKDQAELLAQQAQAAYDSYKDCPVLWCGVDSAEELAEGQKAIWVQELPQKAPSSQKNTNKGKIKAIYIYYPCEEDPSVYTDSQLKNSGIVRVFGYLGIPDTNGGKFPGMIYVHGGEGHASVSSVVEIMNHGYVGLSMDTEGTTNTTGPNNFSESGNAFANDRAGHMSNDGFDSWEKPLEEQWMYWAVGDTILANTVMRSLESVDQVGLCGISWGGIIVNNVITFDYRYDFCVPIYGTFGIDIGYPGGHYGTLGAAALYDLRHPEVRERQLCAQLEDGGSAL